MGAPFNPKPMSTREMRRQLKDTKKQADAINAMFPIMAELVEGIKQAKEIVPDAVSDEQIAEIEEQLAVADRHMAVVNKLLGPLGVAVDAITELDEEGEQ